MKVKNDKKSMVFRFKCDYCDNNAYHTLSEPHKSNPKKIRLCQGCVAVMAANGWLVGKIFTELESNNA